MMVFYMSALLAKRSDLPKYQFICIHIITSTYSIIPFLYTYGSSCSKFLCKSSSHYNLQNKGCSRLQSFDIHLFLNIYKREFIFAYSCVEMCFDTEAIASSFLASKSLLCYPNHFSMAWERSPFLIFFPRSQCFVREKCQISHILKCSFTINHTFQSNCNNGHFINVIFISIKLRFSWFINCWRNHLLNLA